MGSAPASVRLRELPSNEAMPLKERFIVRQSAVLAGEFVVCDPSLVCATMTRRAGSAKGRGRRRIPSTTLKIAVFAPMPSASVRMATTVNAGARSSVRQAKVTSCLSSDIHSTRIAPRSRRASTSRQ